MVELYDDELEAGKANPPSSTQESTPKATPDDLSNEEPEAGSPRMRRAPSLEGGRVPSLAYQPAKSQPEATKPAEKLEPKASESQPFNAVEEWKRLKPLLIRQPKDYQKEQEQAAKEAKYHRAITAISTLLNGAKLALGGTAHEVDFSGVEGARKRYEGLAAAAAKDADRYADESSKLLFDLTKRGYKLDDDDRSYARDIDKMMLSSEQDLKKLGVQNEYAVANAEADREFKAKQAEVDRLVKDGLLTKEWGYRMQLELLKQHGDRVNIYLRASEANKSRGFTTKDPRGNAQLHLDSGQVKEVFGRIKAKGGVARDVLKIIEAAMSGSATKEQVEQAVAMAGRDYPDIVGDVLYSRGIEGFEGYEPVSFPSLPGQPTTVVPRGKLKGVEKPIW